MSLRQAVLHWVCRYGPRPGLCSERVPEKIVADLLAILHEELPGLNDIRLVERVEEFVLAYGTGKWRQITVDGEDWDHRWQPAFVTIADEVLKWVKVTDRWLRIRLRLRDYPSLSTLQAESPGDWDIALDSYAWELAYRLREGKCDCWRLRSPEAEAPIDRNSRLRAERCLREHRLVGWTPVEMSLWNFIARAVKGDKRKGTHGPHTDLSSGAVEQSMFFCALYRDFDVRFAPILGWRCRHHPDIIEGPRCLDCAGAGNQAAFFIENTSRRDVVRRLLVRKPSGSYKELVCWCCQSCNNYYREELDACPIASCKRRRSPGAARSTVWILDPTHAKEPDFSLLPRCDIELAIQQLSPPFLREIVKLLNDGLTEQEVAERLELPLEEVERGKREAEKQLWREYEDSR